MSSSSTIALGSALHTLKFAASNGITWNGTALTITGWAGTAGSSGTAGKIFVGADATGLTTAQLATISFAGYPGTATILSTGEVVPAAQLPIELSAFKASLTDNNRSTLLSFSTATELRNAYFLIERSADGLRFEPIGQVTGAGTSTVQHDYTYTDEHPLKGLNFYRLKQVDVDGQFSYSPVVSVTFGQTGGLRLSPQPVADQLQVSLEQATALDGQWQVYDFAGCLLQSGTLEAESTEFRVPTATLTQGAYVLRLVSGQSVMTRQFQKQ